MLDQQKVMARIRATIEDHKAIEINGASYIELRGAYLYPAEGKPLSVYDAMDIIDMRDLLVPARGGKAKPPKQPPPDPIGQADPITEPVIPIIDPPSDPTE